MLRRYHWAVICLLALLLFPPLVAAQNEDSLEPGDRVIIVAPALDVRVQPGVDSGVAAEVLGGMVSRILAVEDDSGIRWIYLADNAYGWVQVAVDGEPTLALYSDLLLEQMVAEATAAIEAGPNNVEAYAARGSAYLGQGNYDLAIADYSHAIDLSPQDGRLYDYRGKAYLDSENYSMAIADFEQAIALGRVLANTYNRRAIAYDRGIAPDVAIDYQRQAIEIEPGYGLLYSNLGLLYDRIRDTQQAIDYYTQAIHHDPYLAVTYAQRATAYLYIGNTDLAIDDFKQAIFLDPNNQDVVYHLASVYAFLGRYDDAVENYTAAMAVGDRYDRPALLYRGQVYAAQENYTSALTDLNSYMGLVSPTMRDFAAVALIVRGYIHLYRGNYDDARQDYIAAFNTYPDFAANYYTVGGGYRVTPQRESLIYEVQAAIAGDSQNADQYLQLGNLFMEFGRWQEAIATYRQYLSLSPSPALERLVATMENLTG